MSHLGHRSKKLCSKTWRWIFAIKIRLVQNLNNLVKPKLLNFSWILFDHLILYPFLNNFHFIFEHNSSLRYYFIFRILIILFSNYDFRTTIFELRFSNYGFSLEKNKCHFSDLLKIRWWNLQKLIEKYVNHVSIAIYRS